MPNINTATNTLQFIRCALGHETYGLDMSWVQSIQRIDNLLINEDVEIDHTGFIGWLPYNEGDIPVFSMASRLGHLPTPDKDSTHQRIIILPAPTPINDKPNIKGQPWGLLVDQVSRVIEVPGDYFSPLPGITIDPTTNYFEGVIRLDDALILFLSPEWLHPTAPFPPEETSLEGQDQDGVVKNGVPEAMTLPRNGQIKSTNGHHQSKQTSVKSGSLLLFSLNQIASTYHQVVFGLSITQVPEVLRSVSVTPIPTAPPYVLGLIEWRNRTVPVIDLAARLGLTSEANSSLDEQTHIMIARGSGQDALVAFPISTGVQVLPLPVDHQPLHQPLPIKQSLAYGMVTWQDRTLVIPNVTNILEPTN